MIRDNKKMLAIIKMLAYSKGIFVSDEICDELLKSSYKGYRTTSGIFLKLGGTRSEEEFLSEKSFSADDYKEYLKIREWVTSQIFKLSDFNEHSGTSYLKLDADNQGRFVIKGKFISKSGETYELFTDDVGVFRQGEYDDSEAVAVQAGGIRARASICGKNCISGCRFCSFGSGEKNYKPGTFTEGKLNYIKGLIREVVENENMTQLFITGGNPSLEDMEAWTYFLKESIEQFYEHSNKLGVKDRLTVDVMLTPRGFDRYVYAPSERKSKYLEYCRELKRLGVNTVSPNMELWKQEKLEEYCPGTKGVSKSEIGQAGYLDFIDAAVEVFGPFNVRTALIVGLNSVDEVKKAIDVLVKRKCLVVLSPFKAPEDYQTNPRFAQNLFSKEPSADELIELSLYLRKKIEEVFKQSNDQECKMYESNILTSMNAHNSHNTANLVASSFNELDRLENAAYIAGKDDTLVTNLSEFYHINKTRK